MYQKKPICFPWITPPCSLYLHKYFVLTNTLHSWTSSCRYSSGCDQRLKVVGDQFKVSCRENSKWHRAGLKAQQIRIMSTRLLFLTRRSKIKIFTNPVCEDGIHRLDIATFSEISDSVEDWAVSIKHEIQHAFLLKQDNNILFVLVNVLYTFIYLW